MAILYSNDYIKERSLFETKGKKKSNPEEAWSNRLFYVGLAIEALAIIYTVGFGIKNKDEKFLYQTTNYFQAIIYSLALLSLLIHQNYIRNNFKVVNHIVTKKWKLSYKKMKENENDKTEYYEYDFFPVNLMFSWSESTLRTLYFILLAIIAGEIPYFLMTGEKILHELNLINSGNGENIMYASSTNIFLITCAAMCFIVFAWDFILYLSFRSLIKLNDKKNEDEKEIIPFSLVKFRYFLLSDFLSFCLWVCIIIFMRTKDEAWINSGLFSVSLTYSIIILIIRSWIVKSVNVSSPKIK